MSEGDTTEDTSSQDEAGIEVSQTSSKKVDATEPSNGQDSLALVAEVQSLRKHKDWADKKIDQLIRRVRDSEGPQRLLKEEVQQLRLVSSSPN